MNDRDAGVIGLELHPEIADDVLGHRGRGGIGLKPLSEPCELPYVNIGDGQIPDSVIDILGVATLRRRSPPMLWLGHVHPVPDGWGTEGASGFVSGDLLDEGSSKPDAPSGFGSYPKVGQSCVGPTR